MEQVQNQQQRIAMILTMNAFLLGLLVAAGLAEGVPQRSVRTRDGSQPRSSR
jgi:hypothetical protein